MVFISAVCFSYESQEYALAFLCKAFPVSARLNLNSAFLFGVLLCGDGRKVVPKMLSLMHVTTCVLQMERRNGF